MKGGRGARGRCILGAALILRRDDGLEVLALPSLLAAVAVCGVGDLLGLVDGRLFHVGAIHGGSTPATGWDGLGWESWDLEGGCWGDAMLRLGVPDALGSAHGLTGWGAGRAVLGWLRAANEAEEAGEGGRESEGDWGAAGGAMLAVVALPCDFFNCWGMGLALSSPAWRWTGV